MPSFSEAVIFFFFLSGRSPAEKEREKERGRERVRHKHNQMSENNKLHPVQELTSVFVSLGLQEAVVPWSRPEPGPVVSDGALCHTLFLTVPS